MFHSSQKTLGLFGPPGIAIGTTTPVLSSLKHGIAGLIRPSTGSGLRWRTANCDVPLQPEDSRSFRPAWDRDRHYHPSAELVEARHCWTHSAFDRLRAEVENGQLRCSTPARRLSVFSARLGSRSALPPQC